MKTYIALLRGINVSGYNKIKMVDLKLLLESLHLQNIETYIQSGNVIFESELSDHTGLENKILEAIKTKFGYDINIVVIPKDKLKQIFISNPFLAESNIDIGKLCVVVLRDAPDITGLDALKHVSAAGRDQFHLIDHHVYVHCPGGFARTKLTNNLFEKKLKTPATTRNWRTITKLYELSQQHP